MACPRRRPTSRTPCSSRRSCAPIRLGWRSTRSCTACWRRRARVHGEQLADHMAAMVRAERAHAAAMAERADNVLAAGRAAAGLAARVQEAVLALLRSHDPADCVSHEMPGHPRRRRGASLRGGAAVRAPAACRRAPWRGCWTAGRCCSAMSPTDARLLHAEAAGLARSRRAGPGARRGPAGAARTAGARSARRWTRRRAPARWRSSAAPSPRRWDARPMGSRVGHRPAADPPWRKLRGSGRGSPCPFGRRLGGGGRSETRVSTPPPDLLPEGEGEALFIARLAMTRTERR